ncbi:MAG: ABC transporter permease subunit [Ardenticatenaceae bacterium]|nr:ABC transporter permease subunit [Anaerolineales bacterium]MCB8921511.1 ABC transporter permease subunit [Ardenticatenaceae bacterium]MCB8990918.1 ABC transporter permease subunit [Ardenticatenaceae bacterium]
MAEITPQVSTGQESIPFWRDGRVLGVLAQIAFLAAVIIATGWILNNVLQNMDKLGAFRCADGSSSFVCGFNFLRIDAQFDIGETTIISYDPSDAFSRAILVGALNTIRVAVFGIILATILGTLAGIARLSSNWLISNIAKWYVDLMRNTPLLLQLFFLYFGVILLLPPIREAVQPFGLPIYMSQRGIDLPWPVFMSSARLWIGFVVLAIFLTWILWVVLGRREIQLGKSTNRTGWAFLTFLLVAVVGWFVATATSGNNQVVLAANTVSAADLAGLESVMQQRLGVNDLASVSQAVSDGTLTQEAVDTAAFTVCTLRDDRSEVNLTAQLRKLNMPYSVKAFNRENLVSEAFAAGDCDLYIANKETLAAAQTAVSGATLIPIGETPVRFSIPSLQGLNFTGGYKLTPNFAAILVGLVLYTGAFIAEIVRAGIQSVAKGQSEAARALGLSEGQRLRLVVLPQALRVIIPPLTSQYLNLVKNSSLAIAVGFPDLWTTSFITLNQSGQSVQVFIIVMASYLSFSLLISFLLNWYNQRISLVER